MACRRTSRAVWLGAMLLAFVAHARVGDSMKQSDVRYGGAGQEIENAEAFILQGAKNVVYHHGDWIITAAFINENTVRIRYEKASQQTRTQLTKEDVAEILQAEDADGWNAFDESAQKAGKAYAGEGHPPPMLRSASGLMARYQVFKVTVENPTAIRHDSGLNPQLKRVSTRKRVAL